MKAPAISVSMADAANTREHDLGCCCDDCDNDSGTCGMNWEDCEQALAEASAEAAWEGARDSHE